ncbi:MAG: Gfo/Idh/MocA family oxidoreductase [Solirubrobacteraceae bacterium]|nr:Gfo/Idh/MocA family oxidoreductase [Solirubrobacteraceae bacterium]
MTDLRIGIVGLGRMGEYHFNVWSRLDGARVIAIAEPDLERFQTVTGPAQREIDRHADWHDLIARGDIDAISIVAPSSLHGEIATAALAAGIHCLVEKPIATTVPDAVAMTAAAERAGKILTVGHVERFNPAARKLRQLLADGALGRVYRVHATRVGPLPTRIMDAGVALDLATHDLDLMEWLTGESITEITAASSQFAHSHHEDIVQGMIRFGDHGPHGLLDVNWLTPEKRRELVVIGEEGLLRASWVTQDLFLVRSGGIAVGWDQLAQLRGDAEGEMIRFAINKEEPLRAELAAFRDAIVEGGPAPVPALAGARALANALALRESAAQRRPMRPSLETPDPVPA